MQGKRVRGVTRVVRAGQGACLHGRCEGDSKLAHAKPAYAAAKFSLRARRPPVVEGKFKNRTLCKMRKECGTRLGEATLDPDICRQTHDECGFRGSALTYPLLRRERPARRFTSLSSSPHRKNKTGKMKLRGGSQLRRAVSCMPRPVRPAARCPAEQARLAPAWGWLQPCQGNR